MLLCTENYELNSVRVWRRRLSDAFPLFLAHSRHFTPKLWCAYYHVSGASLWIGAGSIPSQYVSYLANNLINWLFTSIIPSSRHARRRRRKQVAKKADKTRPPPANFVLLETFFAHPPSKLIRKLRKANWTKKLKIDEIAPWWVSGWLTSTCSAVLLYRAIRVALIANSIEEIQSRRENLQWLQRREILDRPRPHFLHESKARVGRWTDGLPRVRIDVDKGGVGGRGFRSALRATACCLRSLQWKWTHLTDFRFHTKLLGAGYQCQTASFCPHFVFCPGFVHILSNDCPIPDYFLSFSCFWPLFVPLFLIFVQIWSNICPLFLGWSSFCPVIVLISDTEPRTKSGQKLDWGFFGLGNILPSCNTAGGQKLDKF